MTQRREIHCCGCEQKVQARLAKGDEIYNRRPDLASKSFWRCPRCQLYVGCHPGGSVPLGIIPTPQLRDARGHIHALLDPLWKGGRFRRKALYAELSQRLGWEYHTAMIRDVPEARKVYRAIKEIANADPS